MSRQLPILVAQILSSRNSGAGLPGATDMLDQLTCCLSIQVITGFLPVVLPYFYLSCGFLLPLVPL